MPQPNETPGEGLEHKLDGDGSGNGDGGAGAGAGASTEFEIDGHKYSADDLRAAIKAAGDYEQLSPEFTRKSQELSEAKRLLEEYGKVGKKPNEPETNPAVEQARKILREQIGVIFADDLKPILEVIQRAQAQQEDQVLEAVGTELSKKYDGSHGEPKFELAAVAKAAKENPALISYVQVGTDANGQPQYGVNLEQTYKNINSEFWDKVMSGEMKPPTVVKTERGAGTRSAPTPQGDKRPESDEDRIASAAQFFREAAKTGPGE